MRIVRRGVEYTPKQWSELHESHVGGPSVTQQSAKEDADINVIMRRFGATGSFPPPLAGAMYGDFSGIEDYEDAVAKVTAAQEGFMMLPAEVRARFRNDPGRLIAFAQDATEEDFRSLVSGADAPGGSHTSAEVSAVPIPEAEGSVS